MSKLAPKVRQLSKEIGLQIRTARESAGLSQETLAQAIGMTRTNFARIEQGRTNVTLDSLVKIADGLKLTLTVSVG